MGTLTRAKLLKLADEIRDHERARKAAKTKRGGPNEAEAAFLADAAGKGKALRCGWPDFLLLREDGAIGVEVKRRDDWCSASQVAMFEALETIGVSVFVWELGRPGVLTPWRRWNEEHRPKPTTSGGARRGVLEAQGRRKSR